MEINRKDDGFKIKGWKRVMKQTWSKGPNPKHGQGLRKPHRFALQEGKMF